MNSYPNKNSQNICLTKFFIKIKATQKKNPTKKDIFKRSNLNHNLPFAMPSIVILFFSYNIFCFSFALRLKFKAVMWRSSSSFSRLYSYILFHTHPFSFAHRYIGEDGCKILFYLINFMKRRRKKSECSEVRIVIVPKGIEMMQNE